MPTVYVSNTSSNGYALGSDANSYASSQSKATPKLTIKGALSASVAGDTIVVNAGTYVETSYLLISKTYSIYGDGAVVIKNATTADSRIVHVSSTGSGSVIGPNLTLDCQNTNASCVTTDSSVRVEALTISGCSLINFTSSGLTVSVGGVQNLYVTGCTITSSSGAYGVSQTFGVIGTSEISNNTITISGVQPRHIYIIGNAYGGKLVVNNNVITGAGSNLAQGVYVKGVASVEVNNNVIDVDCAALAVAIGCANSSYAVSSCAIKNNSINCHAPAAGYGVIVGDDGVPATQNNISGVVVSGNAMSNVNHGIIFGYVTGAIARYNTMQDVALALVGKNSTGCKFYGNSVFWISSSGIRAKGGSNDSYINNKIVSGISGAWLVSVSVNPDTSTASTGILIRNNVLYSANVLAKLVQVADTSSATFTDNTYFVSGGVLPADSLLYQGVYFSTFSAWDAMAQSTNEFFEDPLFFDLPGGDIRLLPSSPTVSHGFAMAGTNTSTTLAPVLGTTMEIGSVSGASQAFGTIKNFKILNA